MRKIKTAAYICIILVRRGLALTFRGWTGRKVNGLTPSELVLSVCIVLVSLASWSNAELPRQLNLNPVWKFHLGEVNVEDATSQTYNDKKWEIVSVPHTLKEVSLNLDNNPDARMQPPSQHTFHRYIGWYRKNLVIDKIDPDKKHFLLFEAAMQTTELWVNAQRIGKYEVSGYDSFHFDITDALKTGNNLIAVKVDNTMNENTPPDGIKKKKDFVLFGGLYRDVYLITTSRLYVDFPWTARDSGIRITFPKVSENASVVKVDTTVKNETGKSALCEIKTDIKNKDGHIVSTVSSQLKIEKDSSTTTSQTLPEIAKAKLWSPSSPYLYTAETTIMSEGKKMDFLTTRFGIRTFKFTKDKGFFLNGKHLKLIGSNRHQSWPYIGNAVPNSLHRKDAEMMKACGLNWVRLSHYPHDPAFLDACDELGLMALEEGPSWMGGNRGWGDNLVKSFRSMIRRDRNHPSIIVWNACLNHSGPSGPLVKACKEEDYRPAAAEFPKTPMDFKHMQISGDGALTLEHTGHTYPRYRGEMRGKISGDWELAKRHWDHINQVYLKADNSGSATWCMFDYNTFVNNTEPNMVWHGICDLQRFPKYTYYWHTSELTEEPMAYVVKYSDTGVSVFSNGDEVELYQDTGSGLTRVGRQKPDEGFVLNHPPFSFTVDKNAVEIKAIAYRNGKKAAEHIWKKPGKAIALKVEMDRKTIVADGSDCARVMISALDKQGVVDPDFAGMFFLDIDGPGRIVGGRRHFLRKGKYAVLVKSYYEPGTITIKAKSQNAKTGAAQIRTIPIEGDVYLPDKMPATPRNEGPIEMSNSVGLHELGCSAIKGGWARFILFNTAKNNKPITLNGKRYKHGISIPSGMQAIYALNGLYEKFSAVIAPDQSIGNQKDVSFTIFLDDEKAYNSGPMKPGADPKHIELSVKNVRTMGIAVNGTRIKDNFDYGNWADPKLIFASPSSNDANQKKSDPEPFDIPSVMNAGSAVFIISELVMVNGAKDSYPIKVENCEYQVYSEPWTAKDGKVVSGDVVKLRVRSAKKSGATVEATLQIGGCKRIFRVTTE
ncbi:NPCBM/NEW2 domain-containing protein [Verrucomicrobiota bacterium]